MCGEASEELILDVRPEARFLRGHLRNAYNVPWEEIPSRGFELPSRSQPFLVCCGEEQLVEVRQWFESRLKPWSATVREVPEDVREETGPSPPGRFLFSPSPLLQESRRLAAELRAELASGGGEARALDLGCGSGRDVLVLASSGWQVWALDRDGRALERLRALAARQGCLEKCRTVCCNVESPEDLLGLDRPGGFHLVMVNRHLHRPTLPELSELLAPGGLLLFHTFMEGCSHPKEPEHLLKHGELQQVFGSMDILRDEELPAEDGRVMSFFVARKR